MIKLSNRSGFWLLEVIIVITLFMILVTTVLPSFYCTNSFALVCQLQEIAHMIRLTRQKSVAGNKKITCILDTKNNRYRINGSKKKWILIPKNFIFGYLSQIKGPPSRPCKIITKASTFPENNLHNYTTITAYPDGFLSAGTVYLVDKQKKYMGAVSVGINAHYNIGTYLYEQRRWKILT